MIQANELTKGTLLNYCGNIVEVIGFFEDTIFIKNGRSAGIHIENLEPIPLTEQWLIDFGFQSDKIDEDDEEVFYRLNVKNNIVIMSDYSVDFSIVYLNIRGGLFKYNHVHQLQNLYFALTGKELTKQKTP